MSKTIEKTAKVETYFGNPVVPPVKFDYAYFELEDTDEIPADEMPKHEDLISFVNQKRNAAARSTAQNKALTAEGIGKPTAADPAFRLATMIKMLVANGEDEATATQQAKALLKM